MGDGASSAAQRREQVTWQEEERRRVQRAHYEAHIRGRGVPRAGEIFSSPVQVCRVEEDTVSLVYYDTGETKVVPKSSADLALFTQQTIENLKLDQMKSRKLQKAIAAAEASM